MIRSQKAPIRPAYNQSSANESQQSSTNATDITSYIGKVLTLSHHQVTVEDILGQGGFAFVFLVRSFNQQRYALKRMYVNNQRDLNVCQREISIVKELSYHPNIVKYVDSYVHRLLPTNIQARNYYIGRNPNDENEDDAIYEILLLTEYCSNGPLINFMNEQRSIGVTLNERQILRIFADICNAVSACHFRRPQPILHRDIKLENILIDYHQNYVLCDFGSAILLPPSSTNDHQQYQTNELTTKVIQELEEEIQRYTTLSYRAPEMIDLYSRLPLTLKIDIWAMGCLLYKLMYNTMPFGDSILAIQNGAFNIPDDMAHLYSRDLNLLVRFILETDISKRPDIWQVAYITYKLLGIECPIPNRCQSKIPNLNIVPVPLTESEFRHQRAMALSKAKSERKSMIEESSSIGTAVNPRERPRGIMTPSTSLINFNQPNQRAPTISNTTKTTTPPTSAGSTRSESASQLMFDDDFSQIPSHAISLNNISSVVTTEKNERLISRARPMPSPGSVLGPTSGSSLQQQFLLPPPSTNHAHTHRRSASQTISPTTNQSSFHIASSVDSSNSDRSSDDSDDDQLRTNLHILKLRQYSKMDSQSNSDDENAVVKNSRIEVKSKSLNHHPSTEEAEISFSNKSYIESAHRTSIHSSSNNNNSQTNSNNFTRKTFDDEQEINPFLSAPFHHSPTHKQTALTMNSCACDLNSIVTGKRSSAFIPYQKRDINVVNPTSIVSQTESSTLFHVHDDQSSSTIDVFTNAPFKAKSRRKPSLTTTNTISQYSSTSSNPQNIDLNINENANFNGIQFVTDITSQQQGYSNLSFNANIVDEYL